MGAAAAGKMLTDRSGANGSVSRTWVTHADFIVWQYRRPELHTWQEVTAMLPKSLQKSLAPKYATAL